MTEIVAKFRRSARYGRVVPAWRWRTTPDRLAKMEELRQKLGITKTELVELAIDKFLEEMPNPPLHPIVNGG